MGQAGIEGEERGLTPPSQPEMMQPVSGIVPDACTERCVTALAGFPSRANRVRIPSDAPITMQVHFPPLECPALSQSRRETPLATYFGAIRNDLLRWRILPLTRRGYFWNYHQYRDDRCGWPSRASHRLSRRPMGYS